MPPSTSTRWCPTPEQLMILEEMYKSGLRTPNASQIQKITAHLSFYGKIEGKNVFYWFQNHKARDRQKLRRNMHAAHNHNYNNFKGSSSMHPYNCFGLNHPSGFDNPLAHEYLHQVGAEAATHAEITNYCKWNLDTPPEIQKQQNIGVKSNDDDWMMMMLKEACSTSYCSCKSTKVPLKTLDLFPIKSPTSVNENEEQQQQHGCTTYNFRANKNVTTTSSSMMMMSLDIMSTSSSSSLNHN